MARRAIPHDWVSSALEKPEQRLTQDETRDIFQSRFESEDGRIYLVRAVVAIDKEPPLVITVYRTSKVQKYWRPE